MQRVDGVGDLQRGGLGDLDRELRRVELELVQRTFDLRGEGRIAELGGRRVDRDTERAVVLPPVARIGAGSAQHLAAQGADQAGRLRDDDEVLRHEEAAPRMVPPDECLDAGEVVGPKVDHRLIPDDELVALERIPELVLHRAAIFPVGIAPGRDVADAGNDMTDAGIRVAPSQVCHLGFIDRKPTIVEIPAIGAARYWRANQTLTP